MTPPRRSPSCSALSPRTRWRVMPCSRTGRRHSRTRAGSRRSKRLLGVAWEQSLQRAFLAIPDLMQALNVFYFVGHFVLHGDLLRLALPPLVGRLPQLPRRLPDRDGDLGLHPLALPDRAAAARGRRARGHAARPLRDRHRLAHLGRVLEPRRRRSVAARRLRARRRHRPLPLRPLEADAGRRRRLSAARDPDDRRHRATTSCSTPSPGSR